MEQNEITEKFGESCDPYKMSCFDDINSLVCEQVFSRLNRFVQNKKWDKGPLC